MFEQKTQLKKIIFHYKNNENHHSVIRTKMQDSSPANLTSLSQSYNQNVVKIFAKYRFKFHNIKITDFETATNYRC